MNETTKHIATCDECGKAVELGNIARCNACKEKIEPPKGKSITWEANRHRVINGMKALAQQAKERNDRLVLEAKSTLF